MKCVHKWKPVKPEPEDEKNGFNCAFRCEKCGFYQPINAQLVGYMFAKGFKAPNHMDLMKRIHYLTVDWKKDV